MFKRFKGKRGAFQGALLPELHVSEKVRLSSSWSLGQVYNDLFRRFSGFES